MHTILCIFLCPYTDKYVSAWVADVDAEERGFAESVTCAVCGSAHFVDPKTGTVTASDDRVALFKPSP
jgi:hypothetical protein